MKGPTKDIKERKTTDKISEPKTGYFKRPARLTNVWLAGFITVTPSHVLSYSGELQAFRFCHRRSLDSHVSLMSLTLYFHITSEYKQCQKSLLKMFKFWYDLMTDFKIQSTNSLVTSQAKAQNPITPWHTQAGQSARKPHLSFNWDAQLSPATLSGLLPESIALLPKT